jgi:transcriptional regulator with XRE-family HTH domain
MPVWSEVNTQYATIYVPRGTVSPQSIGERIAQARRELGVRLRRDVSPSDVAEALSVSPATVYRWESDEKSPSEKSMTKLAAFLGVAPAYLRYGVQTPAVLDLTHAKPLSDAALDRADAITARGVPSPRKKKKPKGGAA